MTHLNRFASHRFDCPEGFYVKGSSDVNTTYFNATCLSTGVFETTDKTCELIPCTQAAINSTMATQPNFALAGQVRLITHASGNIPPATSVFFSCDDQSYVSAVSVCPGLSNRILHRNKAA